MIEKSLARGLLDVARRIRVGKTLFRDDELVNEAAHALAAALAALDAQPAAECKAGGACRWRGNASAEFETAHRAAQPADEPAFPHCKQCGSSAWMCSVCPQPAAQPAAEPLTDEQIDMMWRRAGIANNARGAFFAGVAAGEWLRRLGECLPHSNTPNVGVKTRP